ncbi:hypothetical protein ACMFMF_003486 [Clarireedia jacksonii]
MALSIEALIAIITLAITGPSALLYTWCTIRSRRSCQHQYPDERPARALQQQSTPQYALRSGRRFQIWTRLSGSSTVDGVVERRMDLEATLYEMEIVHGPI